MSSTVEMVKQRLSIVDIASQYVRLQRAGANFKARCPFHHEKTPSFMISPERGTYHCFGCGVGGDIFTIVQEMEGVDFRGALKILAEKAGVPLVYDKKDKSTSDRLFFALEEAARVYEKNLTIGHSAYAYLTKRGLTDETIRTFRLGYVADEWRTVTTHLREKKFTDKEIEVAGLAKKTEKGLYDRFRSRIMFPLFDSAGRIVGFSGRIFSEQGKTPDDVAKYINSPETPLYNKSRLLYGYDRAKHNIRKLNFSILVEGQMDLIAVHQAGWGNAVAVSGTAFTPEHIALLMRLSENMVLALDADDAGINAAGRSATAALAAGMDVKVVKLPRGSDPSDYILAEGKEAWKTRVREARHVIEFLLAAMRERHKDDRSYIKAVRGTVLPFVAMIKSAIDRDHFVRKVAAELGVSEDAVRAELKEGKWNILDHKDKVGGVASYTSGDGRSEFTPRLRQAFGIVLWEVKKKKTTFNKTELAELLKRHAGASALKQLKGLSAPERETLRFEAEQLLMHVPEPRLRGEIISIFELVELDRLEKERKDAQSRLVESEKSGDPGAQKAALELYTALTKRIADLQKTR